MTAILKSLLRIPHIGKKLDNVSVIHKCPARNSYRTAAKYTGSIRHKM